jgi:hypothetical protein
MRTVTINIADPVYEQLAEQARQANREASEFISEALSRYLQCGDQRTAGHSMLDIQSFPLGPPIKSWSSRAEMLEGFMDDRG